VILVHDHPIVIMLIAFLAFVAVCLIGFIVREIKRENRNRESAFAPRSASTGGDDSAIQEGSGDSRTVHLARMVDQVSGCPNCRLMRVALERAAAVLKARMAHSDAVYCLDVLERTKWKA
jgi:hypothetical protein